MLTCELSNNRRVRFESEEDQSAPKLRPVALDRLANDVCSPDRPAEQPNLILERQKLLRYAALTAVAGAVVSSAVAKSTATPHHLELFRRTQTTPLPVLPPAQAVHVCASALKLPSQASSAYARWNSVTAPRNPRISELGFVCSDVYSTMQVIRANNDDYATPVWRLPTRVSSAIAPLTPPLTPAPAATTAAAAGANHEYLRGLVPWNFDGLASSAALLTPSAPPHEPFVVAGTLAAWAGAKAAFCVAPAVPWTCACTLGADIRRVRLTAPAPAPVTAPAKTRSSVTTSESYSDEGVDRASDPAPLPPHDPLPAAGCPARRVPLPGHTPGRPLPPDTPGAPPLLGLGAQLRAVAAMRLPRPVPGYTYSALACRASALAPGVLAAPARDLSRLPGGTDLDCMSPSDCAFAPVYIAVLRPRALVLRVNPRMEVTPSTQLARAVAAAIARTPGIEHLVLDPRLVDALVENALMPSAPAEPALDTSLPGYATTPASPPASPRGTQAAAPSPGYPGSPVPTPRNDRPVVGWLADLRSIDCASLSLYLDTDGDTMHMLAILIQRLAPQLRHLALPVLHRPSRLRSLLGTLRAPGLRSLVVPMPSSAFAKTLRGALPGVRRALPNLRHVWLDWEARPVVLPDGALPVRPPCSGSFDKLIVSVLKQWPQLQTMFVGGLGVRARQHLLPALKEPHGLARLFAPAAPAPAPAAPRLHYLAIHRAEIASISPLVPAAVSQVAILAPENMVTLDSIPRRVAATAASRTELLRLRSEPISEPALAQMLGAGAGAKSAPSLAIFSLM